jgi:hypothetical protein
MFCELVRCSASAVSESVKMIKDIGKKLSDYFLGRDIYAEHRGYENKVRETIVDKSNLSALLKHDRILRAIDAIGNSIVPNTIEGICLGSYMYNGDLMFPAFGVIMAECCRNASRRGARVRLEINSNVLGAIINLGEAEDAAEARDSFEKLDDEGEEWKKK